LLTIICYCDQPAVLQCNWSFKRAVANCLDYSHFLVPAFIYSIAGDMCSLGSFS